MATKEDLRIMGALDTDMELWRPVTIPKAKCKSSHCNFTCSSNGKLAPYCCGTCRMIDYAPPDDEGRKQLSTHNTGGLFHGHRCERHEFLTLVDFDKPLPIMTGAFICIPTLRSSPTIEVQVTEDGRNIDFADDLHAIVERDAADQPQKTTKTPSADAEAVDLKTKDKVVVAWKDKCYNCGIAGHIAKDCFKPIGAATLVKMLEAHQHTSQTKVDAMALKIDAVERNQRYTQYWIWQTNERLDKIMAAQLLLHERTSVNAAARKTSTCSCFPWWK